MLYLVATPIGNLKDITFRALEVLRNADIIFCEDTRKTGLLLQHYQISGPQLVSYFEQNELQRIPGIINWLKQNKNVALVSNSGTPSISDPGFKLVREAVNQGLEVVAIPGPCAAITALISSGLPTDKFVFLGFLPKKEAAKKKLLTELKASPLIATYIAYESPERLLESLKIVHEIYGSVPISVHKEMTKVHEERFFGKVDEVRLKLEAKASLKGEYVVIFRLSD